MADKRTNIRIVGLESLQFANVKTSGAFPITAASFSTIGNVVPDSAGLVIEEPPVQDIYIEEEEMPDIQIFGSSKKHIEFALRDLGTQTLLYAFGGSAAAGVWTAPTTAIIYREQAVKAISRAISGYKLTIKIPRASIIASGNLRFAKSDTGTIAFKCTILQPNNNVAPYVITQTAG